MAINWLNVGPTSLKKASITQKAKKIKPLTIESVFKVIKIYSLQNQNA